MLTLPPKASFFDLLKDPAKDPLDYLMKIAQIGDIVKMPISFKKYLVNDPDSIQRILQTNFPNYTKADTHYRRLTEVLGPGLLTNSDEAWAKRRAELQPLFYLKNLMKFSDVILEYTQATLKQWEIYAAQQQYFNIADELLGLLAKISSAVLFGIDISTQVSKVIKLVHTGNDYIANSPSIKPWFPTLKNLGFRIAKKNLDDFLLDAFQHKNISNIPEPLLAHVIHEYENNKISTLEFLGDVKNFFVAGHETTGNALNWTLYCLLKNPHAMQQLNQEIKQVLNGRAPSLDDLNNLVYTELVLQEALRLYPPIWAYERKVLADDELGGYRIPAGSLVTVCPYTIHRHPRYWDNPEEFFPERFLPENSQGRHKCTYIPFGTGPRVCIGKQLAMITTKLILPSILQRFEFSLAQKKAVVPEPLVTLKPKNGIWVNCKKI